VILAGCKAEHFILESSSGKNGRSKKCVGLAATCVSNGINKKLCIIIVTLVLLFGAFASLVLWESGRHMKEQMERCRRGGALR
jgi:long-chain-alcohol oxidase